MPALAFALLLILVFLAGWGWGAVWRPALTRSERLELQRLRDLRDDLTLQAGDELSTGEKHPFAIIVLDEIRKSRKELP